MIARDQSNLILLLTIIFYRAQAGIKRMVVRLAPDSVGDVTLQYGYCKENISFRALIVLDGEWRIVCNSVKVELFCQRSWRM